MNPDVHFLFAIQQKGDYVVEKNLIALGVSEGSLIWGNNEKKDQARIERKDKNPQGATLIIPGHHHVDSDWIHGRRLKR